MATLDMYFVLAILCYICMGGYAKARAEVGRDCTVFDRSKKEDEQQSAASSVERTADVQLEDGVNEDVDVELVSRSESPKAK